MPEHLVDVEVDGAKFDFEELHDGLLNFFSDHDPIIEMAESTAVNTHYGYGCTIDMAGWFPKIRVAPNMPKGARLCLDMKTGRTPGDTAPAQVVGQRNCDEVWLPYGEKAPMPEVDLCGVLHVRREFRRGYKLQIIPKRDEKFYFDELLTCVKRFRFLEEKKTKRLEPFYAPLPDGSQPLPLFEDILGDNFGRFRKKLSEAGLDDVGDLATMTEHDVLQVKGIGVKAIELLNGDGPPWPLVCSEQ